MDADWDVSCRICKSITGPDLINCPCLCKGSLGHVHVVCLELWLNHASRDTCELCQYQYDVVLTRRYTCLQSLRVWIRHSSNRTFIACDLMVALVLSVLTLALCIICMLGINHFVEEGYKMGVQNVWSKGIIDIFLVILLAGYLTTMYSMANDHVRPWYRWWRSTLNVKLLIDVEKYQALTNADVKPPTPRVESERALSSVEERAESSEQNLKLPPETSVQNNEMKIQEEVQTTSTTKNETSTTESKENVNAALNGNENIAANGNENVAVNENNIIENGNENVAANGPGTVAETASENIAVNGVATVATSKSDSAVPHSSSSQAVTRVRTYLETSL